MVRLVCRRRRDELRLAVNVEIDVWDVDAAGNHTLRRRLFRHNLVPLAGCNLIRDFLACDAESGVLKVSFGTGAVAPASGDTTLGTEVFRDGPLALDKDSSKLTVRYYLASTDANGNTLTEAGLHCTGATAAANTGTLYARVTFTGIAKTASVAVTINWELTWSVT